MQNGAIKYVFLKLKDMIFFTLLNWFIGIGI